MLSALVIDASPSILKHKDLLSALLANLLKERKWTLIIFFHTYSCPIYTISTFNSHDIINDLEVCSYEGTDIEQAFKALIRNMILAPYDILTLITDDVPPRTADFRLLINNITAITRLFIVITMSPKATKSWEKLRVGKVLPLLSVSDLDKVIATMSSILRT